MHDGSQQEGSKEQYDTALDKDPITPQMEEEAGSSMSTAGNSTQDGNTFDEDPITPEIERGQQVVSGVGGDLDTDPITREMEEVSS